ncbi:GntR family transcriptional regulator [Streptomyces sp. NPDC056132]|uniref:GntR family transcriptional regulator n=1 Tax=Streptomyces sp. NPDC056132 TaxID=3345722 RepID=UPI0035D61429
MPGTAMTGRRKAGSAHLGDTCHVLLRQIAGDRPSGAALPAPVDLARELGVSEIVLRSALDDLTRERVLRRASTAGYTVTPVADWRITLPVPRPRALVVARDLRRRLRAGVYDSRTELPTVHVLAGLYAAPVDDVRAALRELAAEGLITLPPLQAPRVRDAAAPPAQPSSSRSHT